MKLLVHTPYALPLVIIATVVQLPTLLLLLYPIKAFRRLLSRFGSSKYHSIYVFIDTFQGHYKDGTNGTRDFRAVSSISFLLRDLFCMILSNHRSLIGIPANSDYSIMIYCLITTSLLYGIFQPCKKKYMNIIESVVYIAAGCILLSLGTGHNYNYSPSLGHIGRYSRLYLSMIILVLPSSILIFKFLMKILLYLCCAHCGGLSHRVQDTVSRFLYPKKAITASVVLFSGVMPDRLENPLDYQPLP